MNKSKLFASVISAVFLSTIAYHRAHADPRPPAPTLLISKPAQPPPSTLPSGALHVPFTSVDLTAVGADINVDSITIKQTGEADDNVFEGVLLLDGNGNELTDDSGLDPNHEVEFDHVLTIPMGKTERIIVAGNMASDLTGFDGETPALTITDIEASGVVDVNN